MYFDDTKNSLMRFDYGTIEYDSFIYKLYTDINSTVIKQLCGDVKRVRSFYHCEHGHSAQYYVKERRLYLKELTLCITETELPKIKNDGGYELAVEMMRGFTDNSPEEVQDYACVTYKNINMPMDISETLSAKQIYIDEYYNVNKHTHDDESIFSFQDGILDLESSHIQKSTIKQIDEYAWHEEYRTNPPASHSERNNGKARAFLFEPVGSAEQYSYLLSVIVNYKVHRRIDKSLIDGLFICPKPFFGIKVMRETKPDSREYVLDTDTYDLIKTAVEFNDVDLLNRLFEHIDWNEYADLKSKILQLLYL